MRWKCRDQSICWLVLSPSFWRVPLSGGRPFARDGQGYFHDGPEVTTIFQSQYHHQTSPKVLSVHWTAFFFKWQILRALQCSNHLQHEILILPALPRKCWDRSTESSKILRLRLIGHPPNWWTLQGALPGSKSITSPKTLGFGGISTS